MRLLPLFALVTALATMTGCLSQAPPSNATSADDLEARRQRIKEQDTKVSGEAQARKDRSIAILKSEKVPFIEHLPLIDTEAESTRRTTEQVATRAMALCIVAVKGEGLEQEFVDQLIDKY